MSVRSRGERRGERRGEQRGEQRGERGQGRHVPLPCAKERRWAALRRGAFVRDNPIRFVLPRASGLRARRAREAARPFFGLVHPGLRSFVFVKEPLFIR